MPELIERRKYPNGKRPNECKIGGRSRYFFKKTLKTYFKEYVICVFNKILSIKPVFFFILYNFFFLIKPMYSLFDTHLTFLLKSVIFNIRIFVFLFV